MERQFKDSVSQEIEYSLNTLFRPGDVIEIRIPDTKQKTVSGYFDDFNEAVQSVTDWDGKATAIYVTLNPVIEDLLARASNRLKPYAQNTTSDRDTRLRIWILVDTDPVRPKGISSTDKEHELALEKSQEIKKFLEGQGFPKPVAADSGNGGHLLVAIELPNDEESRDLIKRFLEALDYLFTDERVTVDTSVHNSARVVKLYGTFTCKGDNVPQRPHRRSKILHVPEKIVHVSKELLQRIAEMKPEESKAQHNFNGKSTPLLLEKWVAEHGLSIRKKKPWNGATVYELTLCPFNPEHDNGEARIIQFSSGALSFGCFHGSCQGYGWQEVREKFEPGYKDRRWGGNGYDKTTTTSEEPGPEPSTESTGPITLAEVKEVFSKWLLLEEHSVIDIVLATTVANYYLESDPLWLQIISPPSGAKTEILRALEGAKDVHYLSTFTKSTLISGMKAKVEPSLLPKLTHHVLVLKDFTSILEMSPYDKAEVLSQLREIFDGQYSKCFGTGKTLRWKGHLGFIAGCTPAIDGEILVKQLLGERFILYRMNYEDRKTISQRAIRNNHKEQAMRKELKETFHAFLSQFTGEVELPGCDDETIDKIVALADISSLGRSSVPREGTGDKVIKYVPDPELPPRVAKQFHLLACSLAKVRGKTEVTEEDFKLIQKVSLDCIPKQRRIAIHALLINAEDWKTTRALADKMKYPVSTTRLILEDLHVLGLCDRRFAGGKSAEELSQNTPYEWQIDGEFYNTVDEAFLGEENFE